MSKKKKKTAIFPSILFFHVSSCSFSSSTTTPKCQHSGTHPRPSKLWRSCNARKCNAFLEIFGHLKMEVSPLNKAILRRITYSSSHHHIQHLHERGRREGGRETDFKAVTCSEIYLREGPHSLIDANTFPERHTTCSCCQSYLTLCGIDACYTFYLNYGKSCVLFVFLCKIVTFKL